jgi:spore coat protein A
VDFSESPCAARTGGKPFESLLGLMLAALFPVSALATTVDLVPSGDNTLYEASGSLSNGAGSFLFAGRTSVGGLHRSLLRFDLAAAIPKGSPIEAATLRLTCSRSASPGVAEVSLFRLTEDWGEGGSIASGNEGSGAAAAAGDATWSHRRYATTLWQQAGGSCDSAASATTDVYGAGSTATWDSAALKADVQAWVNDPASNFGWMLAGDEDRFATSKRFQSRQHPDAESRPTLSVSFSPAGPVGACCAFDGSCTAEVAPGDQCLGSWQGQDTSCLPNVCPQPAVACCLPVPAASCVLAQADECAGQGGLPRAAGTTCQEADCPVVLEPFVDPLPIPAAAVPVHAVTGAETSYALSMREVLQKLHRDLPPSRVWGFGDGSQGATYPGPTIEARSGQTVNVRWINDLRGEDGELRSHHLLPVDSCVHGAHHDGARTVIHLHGGHVPADSDGNPDEAFLPGEEASYAYPNRQQASTLWYHDHALGITRLNVYLGLAGFYLLRDEFEDALQLPRGEYDVPLLIQDRSFRPDGSHLYPASWQEHFFGDTLLVNGKVQPRFDVRRGRYRFRILNGCTSRTLQLRLSTEQPFFQIGSDGGLLGRPVELDEITIAPGERTDVVLDFHGNAPGTGIVLSNKAPAPYPNGEVPGAATAAAMKFVVMDEEGTTSPLPEVLRSLEPPDEQDAASTREFLLRSVPDACGGVSWRINGLGWHDITEFPRLGTSEIWRFVNHSHLMHPMHLHLGMFRMLDRQPVVMSGEDLVPTGSPAGPEPGEEGWKDTVQVGPMEAVRVLMRFEDYKGRFPYHCHILEHEDHEMMRQFETVVCGDGRPDPGEACDLGDRNGEEGSCCSWNCESVPDCVQTTTTIPPTTTVVVTSTVLVTTTTVLAAPVCGDATGNGNLTAEDALRVLRNAVGTLLCEPCVCDANGSGSTTASDALLVLRAAVGQQGKLACPDCGEADLEGQGVPSAF